MARGVSQGCFGGGLLLTMAFGSFDWWLHDAVIPRDRSGLLEEMSTGQSATGVQIGILSMIGRGLWLDNYHPCGQVRRCQDWP